MADEETGKDKGKMSEEFPLLTEAEVAKARDAARLKVVAERRKAALAEIEDKEMKALRHAHGLITGETAKDEEIFCTLDLAPFADRIVINFMDYYHGQTYKVPRHVADSLRDIQAQGWRHQDEIDGKTLTEHFQQQMRKTAVSARTGLRVAVE